MIDIREILVRIFSAIFLSMCTGSCMFVFWMALRKFFADKIRPKVYDLILKIILIAYYVPAGYLLVNIFLIMGMYLILQVLSSRLFMLYRCSGWLEQLQQFWSLENELFELEEKKKDAFHARCMCKRSLKIVKESLEFADQ